MVRTIAEVLPGKRITGMEFRALFATAIENGDFESPNMSFEEMRKTFADFINTSLKVAFLEKLKS